MEKVHYFDIICDSCDLNVLIFDMLWYWLLYVDVNRPWWKKHSLLLPQSQRKEMKIMIKELTLGIVIQTLKKLLVNLEEISTLSSPMVILVRSKIFLIWKWENLQLNKVCWLQRMCLYQKDQLDLILSKHHSSKHFKSKPKFKKVRLKSLRISRLSSRIQELIPLKLFFWISSRFIHSSIKWRSRKFSKMVVSSQLLFLISARPTLSANSRLLPPHKPHCHSEQDIQHNFQLHILFWMVSKT